MTLGGGASTYKCHVYEMAMGKIQDGSVCGGGRPLDPAQRVYLMEVGMVWSNWLYQWCRQYESY